MTEKELTESQKMEFTQGIVAEYMNESREVCLKIYEKYESILDSSMISNGLFNGALNFFVCAINSSEKYEDKKTMPLKIYNATLKHFEETEK